ncbi:MAG: AAA family ATPase [Verrucomicrobiales bacterium]|nr:AAA family ATPase [Verrucomicrobiales bacterium]
MIRTHFGLSSNPFTTTKDTALMEHQQRHFDILKVHSQQGGLCVILGEPGTGKTVLKNAIIHHNPKQWITPVINRSLHTWHNMLRMLCQAFGLESNGSDHRCEQRLINCARSLNGKGKQIIPIIDDAQLIPIDALRKLRLLLEDFPKNHNLVLLGQPDFNATLQLRVNEDIRSRITYSATVERLAPEGINTFIHSQLDLVGLPHSTFTDAALHLIARSSEGALRAVKNLCIGSMIEAGRESTKIIDTKQVNAVLLQPHWRHNQQQEPKEAVFYSNQKAEQK